DLLIGDPGEQMVDAVKTCAFLGHPLDDPPRGLRNMRSLQHCLLGFRVLLPAPARFQIHRTELPLLDRVMDSHQEPEMLFLVRCGHTVLDQNDPGTDVHALEVRYRAEKLFDILLRAETHNALDADAVVPTAVEQHDLAASGKMRQVTLEVPLRAFALAGRR